MAEIDLGRVVGPPGEPGTTDYAEMENKPSINGTVLEGDRSPAELGLAAAEEGKGLSSNDYTDGDKEKLAGIDEGANRYTHPGSHPASMIGQDAAHRFVSDAKQKEWDGIYAQAVAYVDMQVAALIDGAPDDLNTLREIAGAMRGNADVLAVLQEAIGKKANELELAAAAFSGSYNDLSDKPHIPSAMAGASASAAGEGGTVPAPAAGEQGKFLRGDGTWQVPANTTYAAATQSKDGLMSAADKQKLDGIGNGSGTGGLSFGQDGEGNWGYIPPGETEVVPFGKSGGGFELCRWETVEAGLFEKNGATWSCTQMGKSSLLLAVIVPKSVKITFIVSVTAYGIGAVYLNDVKVLDKPSSGSGALSNMQVECTLQSGANTLTVTCANYRSSNGSSGSIDIVVPDIVL